MALDVGTPENLNVEDIDTTDVQALPTTNLTDSELQEVWMSELDESMFEASKLWSKLTRKQKCDNCRKHNEVPSDTVALTDISREQLKKTNQRFGKV